MSHHSPLPVWKAAMDLAAHLEHAVRSFPGHHKYTLGTELRHTAQRLCQPVRFLAQETRAFAHFNEFATTTELTVGLGKQGGGVAASGQLRCLHSSRMRRTPQFTVRPGRPTDNKVATALAATKPAAEATTLQSLCRALAALWQPRVATATQLNLF